MKEYLTDLYNRFIVLEWYKKWSTWALALALALPDILQFALENLDALSLIPTMDDATKAQIRYALITIAFIVRVVKQKPQE